MAPEQPGGGAAAVLVVLHPDGIALAGGQCDRSAVLGRRVVVPLIDDLHAVHPQPHAIVADRVEGVGPCEGRLDLAGPSCAEGVGANRGRRRAGAPGEVHGRVSPRHRGPREVHVVEVGRGQPRTRAAAAGDSVRGRIGRVRAGRPDRMGRGAAVGPRHEFVGRSTRRLRRGGFEAAVDADDRVERQGCRDRLAVEPKLQPGRVGRQRERDLARKDVALDLCVSPAASRTVR